MPVNNRTAEYTLAKPPNCPTIRDQLRSSDFYLSIENDKGRIALGGQIARRLKPMPKVGQPTVLYGRRRSMDARQERSATGGNAASGSPLAALAAQFDWIAPVAAPDAPGFHFFGGALDPAKFVESEGVRWPIPSLSGKGFTAEAAFAGCVGEGVEHLSRLEWGDEVVARAPWDEAGHGLDADAAAAVQTLLPSAAGAHDWVRSERLIDGAAVLAPADLVLRRAGAARQTPPAALSTGCAAGESFTAATLAALYELVERDAAALWWAGGRRARAVGLERQTVLAAPSRLAALRQGVASRTTHILDIASDIGVPTFVAFSTTSGDDRFAVGLAADLDASQAVVGAILEMCQSELGFHLAEAKGEARGSEALNEADKRKLARDRAYFAEIADRLQAAPPTFERSQTLPATAEDRIGCVVTRMRALGVSPLRIDLTRPALGVPAVRVLAPGLQPYPARIATARLEAEMARNGREPDDLIRRPLFAATPG